MKIKRLTGIVVAGILIASLGFTGYYVHKKKSQHALQNALIEAVRRGEIVVDQESHHWKIRSDEEPYEPITIELFIRNQGPQLLNGNVVFTGEMETVGIEESYLIAALSRFRKDGFQNEQCKEKSFSAATPKLKALCNYLQRGEKLLPGMRYEPFERPPDFTVNKYSFAFRQIVFLRPGEVKRITHDQDIPYNLSGFVFKIEASSIEFQ